MDAMDAIRQALSQSDKTNRELSAETGIHEVNLSQFKSGTRDINDWRQLKALAAALGMKIEVRGKRRGR